MAHRGRAGGSAGGIDPAYERMFGRGGGTGRPAVPPSVAAPPPPSTSSGAAAAAAGGRVDLSLADIIARSKRAAGGDAARSRSGPLLPASALRTGSAAAAAAHASAAPRRSLLNDDLVPPPLPPSHALGTIAAGLPPGAQRGAQAEDVEERGGRDRVRFARPHDDELPPRDAERSRLYTRARSNRSNHSYSRSPSRSRSRSRSSSAGDSISEEADMQRDGMSVGGSSAGRKRSRAELDSLDSRSQSRQASERGLSEDSDLDARSVSDSEYGGRGSSVSSPVPSISASPVPVHRPGGGGGSAADGAEWRPSRRASDDSHRRSGKRRAVEAEEEDVDVVEGGVGLRASPPQHAGHTRSGSHGSVSSSALRIRARDAGSVRGDSPMGEDSHMSGDRLVTNTPGADSVLAGYMERNRLAEGDVEEVAGEEKFVRKASVPPRAPLVTAPRGSRYDDDEDEEPGRRRGAGSGNVIAPYPVSAEQQVASPARGQAAMQPVLAAGAPGPHPLPAAASSAVTMPAPSRHNPLLHGCRPVTCYQPLGKIDEGTYGVVYHARDIETGEEVALKKIKFDASVANEGFPITALRETNVLLMLRHPNIVSVREMVVGRKKDEFYMVMDYMDHDVKGMMAAAKHPLSQAEVKCLMQQLLRGVAYMHANWVIHRDLKTSNLLMDNAGRLCVADFGLARKYGSPVRSYTQSVVTLWYRAPELLLGATTYTTAVDMWSVGCIFAELLSKKPLFQAHTEMKQLSAIFDVLGTPTDDAWPAWRSLRYATEFAIKPRAPVSLRQVLGKGVISFGGGSTVTESGMDLLRALLCLNPDGRCTAAQALQHPWFAESPPPTEPHLMPICPPSRKR